MDDQNKLKGAESLTSGNRVEVLRELGCSEAQICELMDSIQAIPEITIYVGPVNAGMSTSLSGSIGRILDTRR